MWCNPPSSMFVLQSVILFSTAPGYQGTYPLAHPPDRESLYPVLVVVEVDVERSKQRQSQVLQVQPVLHIPLTDGCPQEPQYGRASPVVGGVREALQPVSTAQGLVPT